MNDGREDALARLIRAVHDLEDQVGGSPEWARPAVQNVLDGVLGAEYALRAVTRISEDIKHTTRQAESQERTVSAT